MDALTTALVGVQSEREIHFLKSGIVCVNANGWIHLMFMFRIDNIIVPYFFEDENRNAVALDTDFCIYIALKQPSSFIHLGRKQYWLCIQFSSNKMVYHFIV